MGRTFAATTKAADASEIEAGMYDGRFDGVEVKFIKGGQYGDGDRFEWRFTLVGDDGAVLYDDGEPIEVTGLTSQSTNTASKTVPRAVRYLKALMTGPEFTKFEAGEGVDEDALVGRVAQVEVATNDNGWPTIANVIAPRVKRSGAKAKPKASEDSD